VAKAVATDLSGNRTETLTTIQVLDPTDTDAPQIDLNLSGITDGVITAPTQIRGTVTDTNLDYYVLEVAPLDGSTPFKEVFRGSAIVSDGILGTFDPSLLQNDTYILRLTAYDTNGQGSTTESTIAVAGELKLGNFRLSFTDLTIPVTGIPITVTRTYDTLTSNNTDDFGYGWRMEFRDTDLRTSLGVDEQYELFGIKSKGFKEGTRVYITLPGGKREAFTFKPTVNRLSGFLGYAASGGGVNGFDTNLYNPAFEADKGVTSTLSVRNPESSGNMLSRNLETGMFRNLGGQLYDPADSYFGGIYVLTTKEGIEYEIDGKSGDLLKVTDTNGNVLTFTDTNITSSTGQQVTFERDAQNRITAVIDPMGNKVSYAYDAKGDLIAVSDREGNTTRYEYDESQAHYLDKIIDPLGRTGVRNEYGDDGKLKKILDANGNAVEMVYDPNNSIQKVKDALDNETVYEYDDRGNVVTEIDAEGKITRRSYDADSRILKETVISDRSGPQGFTTEYSYDREGNKTTETDPSGNVTRYTYGEKGRLLSITDPLGRSTTNTYSRQGNLLSTMDADGNVTRFSYSMGGNLLTMTDDQGNTTRFSYDNQGNVTEMTDVLGNTTTYTYNANGDKLTETRTKTTPKGVQTLVTAWTYDEEGQMLSITDAEGQTTRYEYNAKGLQIAVIDALGRKTESRYDDRGELIEVLYPDATPNDNRDNLREQHRYDATGQKIAVIDMAGRETRFVYDAVGRLLETIYPDATPTIWTDNARSLTEYFTDGLVKAQIDERGNRTEFLYDAKGQQIAIIYPDATPLTLADNPRTLFEYNAAGQQVVTTDALGNKTQYYYDERGRVTSIQYADLSTTSYTYDSLGRRIASTDQNGKTTHYRYDALGRLTGVQNALGDWTEYGYNEVGNLVWQEDALDHRTSYEYDGVGRRTTVKLAIGQSSTTVYDAVGNLISYTDFNRNTTSFTYDPLNQLTQKQFQDGTTTSFTYTPVGLRQTATDSRGTTTYNYNERDWLTSRTDPDGSKINYSYDVAGNRTSVTTASSTVNYTFNERNWLDLVSQNGAILADYDYNALGNLTHTQFANGTEEIRQYNNLNQLTSLKNQKLNGEVLSSYTYTLDKMGNRLQMLENNGRKVSYSYDDLYRLTQEQITDPVNGNRTDEYSYDKVGNRISRIVDGQINTYIYDVNDRLLAELANGQITTAYTYDDNGNTLTKVEDGIITSYTWNADPEARLVQATVTNVSGVVAQQMSYQYDADGMRVSAIVNGQQTNYLLDTVQSYTQVLEEYSPDGTVNVAYVYGNDLINQTRSSNTTYYHVDCLGSTRLLTNAQGNITDSYDYDAFGTLTQSSGITLNSYQFTGEQYDSQLNNYYLRQRFYNPEVGRFNRRDTFEGKLNEPISLHKYLYANGNPTNYVDPSGYSSIIEGDWIHNLIGAHFISQYGIPLTFPLNPMDSSRRRFTVDRVFDPRFPLNVLNIAASGSRNRPTNLRVVRTALNNPNHKGIPGYNGQVPDLADFRDEELYEIKPNNSRAIQEAQNKLTDTLNEYHSVGLTGWSKGTSYAPPAILVIPNGNITSVKYASAGVIVYDIYNTRLALSALSLSAKIMAAAISELLALISAAAARSQRTWGLT
jgi:RHS repeat-associated protein